MLPVNFLPVANSENSDGQSFVINVINNSISSRADAPGSAGIVQLFATGWPWILRKGE